MKKLQPLLVAFLLAIFGFVLLPSQYYTGDMVIHLQYIKEIQNTSLFRQDYTHMFAIPQKSSSLYYPLIAFVTTVSPLRLYSDLRLLYFLFLIVFFLGLLSVVKTLGSSLWVGMVLSILLLTQVHIGGSAVETIESDFVPRGISLALVIWSYRFVLKKCKLIGVFILLLSLAVHVLTGIYAVYFYFWQIMLTLFKKNQRLFKSIIACGGILILIWVSSQNTMSHGWLEILRLRNSYAFYDLWPPTAWSNLGLLLIPGIAGLFWLSDKQKQLKQLFGVLLSGVIVLSAVHSIFAILFPQWWMIILQIGRSWIYVIYASFFMGAVLVSEKIPKRLLAVAVSAGLVLVASYHTWYRTEQNVSAWVEVQELAQNHTQLDCVFLTPFLMPGFRVAAERAIVGDIKDGTLSFYSEAFAREWKKRRDDLDDWESFPLQRIESLQKKYKFNYLVTQNQNSYELPIIFKNNEFAVYKVTSSPICRI